MERLQKIKGSGNDHQGEETTETLMGKYDIHIHVRGLQEIDQFLGSLIPNLRDRRGSEFSFCTKPAGSAFLLLLKERWLKRPAVEEQEGREP
ncbi:hypothetical protein XENOCAPTIV_021618 [Xenoophorus captivus]|uniref:Uncharacterized protein n=1 Tax=Xenoophorus captivus TaxID=1517983 RepID=A0ABV0QC20_9TELE